MYRKTLITHPLISACLLCLLHLYGPAASTAETTVYQWQGESGQPVFGDLPRPGAREIRIPDPPTYAPPALPAEPGQPAQETQQAPPQYEALTLAEPQPETTIWSNPGNFQVRFEVTPPLRTEEGHRLVITLDDKAKPPIAGTRYYFENLNRGAHHLKARVVDTEGSVLIESDPATIYLQQQSIHYPAR